MDFCGFNRWLRPAFSRVSTKNLPLIVFPRLDFQTFSGFEVDTVTTGIGVCTDSFQAAGQTGVNPPAICGTNTGYHSNWVRLSGPVSVCSVSVRGVWGCCWRHDHTDQHPGHWHLQLEHPRQADLLHISLEVSRVGAIKILIMKINIIINNNNNNTEPLQTVSSTSLGYPTPSRTTTTATRCCRIRTSKSFSLCPLSLTMTDTLLLSENCVRTNKGYCRIQWQESPGTTPDTFQLDTLAGTTDTLAAGGVHSPTPADPTALAQIACPLAYVQIPDGSVNGLTPLPQWLRIGI